MKYEIGDLVGLLGFDSEILDYGIIVAEKIIHGQKQRHMIKVRWFVAKEQAKWIWRNQECLEKIA